MAGSNSNANDSMIRRMETELGEAETFCNGIIERANSGERDLSDDEKGMLVEKRSRMTKIKDQITDLEDITRVATEVRSRASIVDNAILKSRLGDHAGGSPVEYRSAGAYMNDMYAAALGRNGARERLEVYLRAADNVTTPDEPGVIPTPIVGPVINFIDAARPIVNFLGPQELNYATWFRPHVTQHTSVAPQGVSGSHTDENTELVSQRLKIERLQVDAKTYGGYVNVSRQAIDFSQPAILDTVINDLAAEYAIETEAATATTIASTTAGSHVYDPTSQASIAKAVWQAAADVYTAVRGQGRLLLVISPDRLGLFGPLFAPYGPFNQYGQGFDASNFKQGTMGVISGVPTVMSSGLTSGEAFVLSSSALEVYEQRVGTLQLVEPSVVGVQIAYAGYFANLKIVNGGIVPLVSSGS